MLKIFEFKDMTIEYGVSSLYIIAQDEQSAWDMMLARYVGSDYQPERSDFAVNLIEIAEGAMFGVWYTE